MFAYVNFLSGPYAKKKKIFPISEIVNFKPDLHKKNIKYQVLFKKEKYPVTVLLVGSEYNIIISIIVRKTPLG